MNVTVSECWEVRKIDVVWYKIDSLCVFFFHKPFPFFASLHCLSSSFVSSFWAYDKKNILIQALPSCCVASLLESVLHGRWKVWRNKRIFYTTPESQFQLFYLCSRLRDIVFALGANQRYLLLWQIKFSYRLEMAIWPVLSQSVWSMPPHMTV